MDEKELKLDKNIEFIEKVKKNNQLLKSLTEGLLSEIIIFNVNNFNYKRKFGLNSILYSFKHIKKEINFILKSL